MTSTPCATCRLGGLTVMGSGQRGIAVPMTAPEAMELVFATSNARMRERLLTAIGILDPYIESALREELTAS